MGRTPNPDVLCNREIKFDVFMKIALDLGADFVATGHYCQKTTHALADGTEVYNLEAGADPNKDQSYFLCQLSQEQLSKTLFPIGSLQKSEVRAIAAEAGLITADKKDSQGLCFIGKVRLPDFLQQQLKPKKGVIIEIPSSFSEYHKTPPEFKDQEAALAYASKKVTYKVTDGKQVGEHQGAHYFTNGQRKGLNVGGTKEPLFVIATDVNENVIYTGQGKSHPGLYRNTLFVTASEVHWVRPDLQLNPGKTMEVMARIRYRQALEKATLYATSKGLYVAFENPQSAITAGQFVAWYQGTALMGSGVIG
jgi:tRNA-specific 2-thiouridylase